MVSGHLCSKNYYFCLNSSKKEKSVRSDNSEEVVLYRYNVFKASGNNFNNWELINNEV